ncbi:Cell division protein FtsZ [Porphyromonas cangingivalis]|uniref:cell division protein FtsZ n=1 Tax=Porphyromonas cangingivalis TaxID=36874 RepID=UPI000D9B9453|nr:cell division protein FtsZ [Porphyromonas cangingivalis]SPY35901.1 Cell division protein FtsZ [Porphyromonas cangingivalis]
MEDKLLHINNKREANTSIIKVIGVGGGGGNAVNHMYDQHIKDVSFLLCNTDRQHLNKSRIPTTLCIGEKITMGLGAGNRPERAQQAAEESKEDIRKALSDGTRMVFITAGMGGGTGTGAAPVIARIAKEMGILTVGIVTIPFLFEGQRKILQAIKGVEEMSQNVDAILVIKNELLRKVYPDLKVSEAFKRADETLTTAARSISELVTDEGDINVDFADVSTILTNGGLAIISRGFASGPNSVYDAIKDALHSPLVNTSNFQKASRVLLYITYSEQSQPDTEVFDHLNSFMARILGDYDFIWGCGKDESLGDQVRVTLLASGFDVQTLITDETAMEKIKEYYGDEMKGETTFRTETSVIFTVDELEDETFISMICDTPTLKRSSNTVDRYRAGRKGAGEKSQTNKEETQRVGSHQPIHEEVSVMEPENTKNDEPELDDELIMFGR